MGSRLEIATSAYEKAPISRLPPEMLAYIFLWHIWISGIPDAPFKTTKTHYRWIRITHRSRETQLHISTLALYSPWIPSLEAIIPQCTRAITLDLLVTNHELDVVSRFFPPSAPCLRELQLAQKRVGRLYWKNLSSLPSASHGRMLSFLQSFEVVYVEDIDTGFQVSYSEVVCVLHGLPLLEQLVLVSVVKALPSGIDSPPPISEHISLPKLHHIKLQGDPLVTVHLLDHLIVPPDTNIQMLLVGWDPLRSTTLPFFADALRSKVKTPIETDDLEPLCKLCIGDRTLLFFKRTPVAPAASSDVVSLSSVPQAHLSVQFFDFPNSTPALSILDAAARVGQLPSRDVKELEIQNISYFPSAWENILRTMPNVRTLRFSGTPSRDGVPQDNTIVRLLSTHTHNADMQCESLLMPHLKHVELDQIEFKGRDTMMSGEHSVIAEICEVVKEREEAGFKLELVTIKACRNVTVEDISLLRMVVGTDRDGEEK
ncbi:hypothetical protein BXZ70DRAFT_1079727 [Cristinia sonorae]|uniref:Uncharacterized protein n=1 Tax=Cristinia sonorae TaxID=1940300 RepID=A0A8K0UJG7_9AGAR|nr:hypothetical protein BXZ70DRAFT_1079727 [Cristinia sonorae]